MEDSNNLNKSRISQQLLSIIKNARDQNRNSKSLRVTFNVPQTDSFNKKGRYSRKSKSLSSKSEVSLVKLDENLETVPIEFENDLVSDENLEESQIEPENDKLELNKELKTTNQHVKFKKPKKKLKRKLTKITYKLKKPKPKYNRPRIETPKLEATDRPILITYFKKIVKSYLQEKRRNRQLHRKVRKHLIRRKIKKAFRPHSERKDDAYKEKYYKNLERIYELKQEIQLAKEAYAVEKMVCSKKRDELIRVKNGCIEDFNATVYSKALEIEISTNLIPEKLVKRLLSKFHKFYNEVSNLRMKNFKIQQIIAKYIDKEKKIEEIGDGLTLFDYENTKTRLQIITSNIDAKNKILERMRMRLRKDIKDDEIYTRDLEELNIELSEVKETLHKLKTEHAKLFNESKRLKSLEKQLESKLDGIYVKGQLLSERILMLEYDKMEEKYNVQNDEFARLKDENQKLDQKFRKYEEELKTLEKGKKKAEKNVEPLCLYEERVALFRKTRTS